MLPLIVNNLLFLVTLCRRVASDSWRHPWQLLSIPLYLWRIVSCCWWWLRSSTPWVCPAIFVLVFLSFSPHSFSRASRHLPSLLLSPRAQSSLMQPLAPLTPVSIPVWCSRLSICLSFSPSTILSVLFSNTTTRKRRSSFSHVFSVSCYSVSTTLFGYHICIFFALKKHGITWWCCNNNNCVGQHLTQKHLYYWMSPSQFQHVSV